MLPLPDVEDVFKSGMELGMAGSALALSFLVAPGALFLILKSNSIFEYIPFNIM
jgi:hypothetical protein